MSDAPVAPPNETIQERNVLNRITSFVVYLFEPITPDPYIFAVAITIVTALLAAALAPKGSVPEILTGWYAGLFEILAFAFQMVLILVTGYALSNSPPIRRFLDWLASRPKSRTSAIVLTIVTVMGTSFLNWGCGLVVAGLLAREIAKRMRLDFGWLGAGAYSGWFTWASGFSRSIALAQATPGSALNLVQKVTGQVIPLGDTIFAPFNWVPVIVLLILLPLLYCAIQPTEPVTMPADAARVSAEDTISSPSDEKPTIASHLERAWILNLIIVAAGIGVLALNWSKTGPSLDINSVIFLFLLAGMCFHLYTIKYIAVFNPA